MTRSPEVSVQPIPRALRTLTDDAAGFRADPPAEPRLAHRDPAALAALHAMPMIDAMLADNALAYPLFAMSRDGARLPGRRYTCAGRPPRAVTRELTRDLPDLPAIRDQLAGGSTLILEQLHRTCRPVAAFCRRLSYELGRPVWATSYLTPVRAQGFGLHYDTHGVFVLQCAGRKTWELYPPILPHPLDGQRWREEALTPEDRRELKRRGPHARFELEAGDVLWIPRGWLHEVFTTGDASLHVSLSIPEVSRYELVSRLMESLAESEEFRLDLPFDAFTGAERAREESELVLKAFGAWVARADPAQLAERALGWLRALWYPARCSPVAAVVGPDERIAGAAGLSVPREAVIAFEYTGQGGLSLTTAEGETVLDPPAAGLVGALLAADDPGPVPIARFRAELGPETVPVIRLLLGRGIAELVEEPAG